MSFGNVSVSYSLMDDLMMAGAILTSSPAPEILPSPAGVALYAATRIGVATALKNFFVNKGMEIGFSLANPDRIIDGIVGTVLGGIVGNVIGEPISCALGILAGVAVSPVGLTAAITGEAASFAARKIILYLNS